MEKISNWLRKKTSTWLMLASLLVMVCFMVFVLPAQAARSTREIGAENSPDMSLYYSPEELHQMAEEYGEAGRQAYIRSRWTFDLVFPLVYTAFLVSGISWFSQRLTHWGATWKLTNLLPLWGGIFDLLENTATSLVMALYPAKSSILLISASLFTPIKWALVSVSFFPYLILGTTWLVQKVRFKQE